MWIKFNNCIIQIRELENYLYNEFSLKDYKLHVFYNFKNDHNIPNNVYGG